MKENAPSSSGLTELLEESLIQMPILKNKNHQFTCFLYSKYSEILL